MRSCGAPGEEAAALAMLEITVSIFSAKGRAASAAVCARRSLEAATICMALVIFCVALVEAMRTRMSFSDAILRSPRRSDLQAIRPQASFVRARPNAGRRHLCKCLGETLDHALQLGLVVVRELARVADGVEDLGVLAAQQR